ncbi:MAG TPA: hypothetical protein VFK48_01635 [Usitatibacter sp.]|nr:hypothetical protein [Usitatibacter sp.]
MQRAHTTKEITMHVARRIAGLAVCSLFAFSVSGAASAVAPEIIGPIHAEGTETGLLDCGTFRVDDRWELNYTLRFMRDGDGNRVRLVEQVWGVDNFTNSVTGKTIAGPYHNNTFVDLIADRAVIAGIIFRANSPGMGAVFLDLGRIEFTGDDITFVAGKHQFFDGDLAALCAALE